MEGTASERATPGGTEEGRLGQLLPFGLQALSQGVPLLRHRLRAREGQAPDPCGSEEGVQRQGEIAGRGVSSLHLSLLICKERVLDQEICPGSALICHLWSTLTMPGPQQNMRSPAGETEISPSGQIVCRPLPELISPIQFKAPSLQAPTEGLQWEALPCLSLAQSKLLDHQPSLSLSCLNAFMGASTSKMFSS